MRLNGSEFNQENLIDALSTLKEECVTLKRNGINHWRPKKGAESLDEDPVEVDHVEAEIMDESANFRRPENQIAEEFIDYHGNSDHEETRDTLEPTAVPQVHISEAAAEAKNESKALIQLLDDYGSSDSEDEEWVTSKEQEPVETSTYFFRKSPHRLAPDDDEPEANSSKKVEQEAEAPKVIVSAMSELTEIKVHLESSSPASSAYLEDTASSEIGKDTKILSQSSANSPDDVSPEIPVVPEKEVEVVGTMVTSQEEHEDQKAGESGNKVVDQEIDDKGHQEDDSSRTEQVLEEAMLESPAEEFIEADLGNGDISESQDQKDQDFMDFEGNGQATEIPGASIPCDWRPTTPSKDSETPEKLGNSKSSSEPLNEEAKLESNGLDVQNQEEKEFVDVEGAREVPHHKDPDKKLAFERSSEDDEEVDDGEEEEFLKEEMELLEWNQEHSKEKPNELGPGIIEASKSVASEFKHHLEPLSPASTASLEDVASSES
ncbi:Protein CBG26626 [Caenorhabditis briggsae]|uniref:Protein CBG26626 n=1 Tax=Caenorhabditis briggsae TaxID=6238 RepID=B6ILJ6_CAEBR|nr:Protein CBG26626 [Caenorhabditis briggsae]CAS00776.1 Protein CBG26626 [Caenorhabditis briggsae]